MIYPNIKEKTFCPLKKTSQLMCHISVSVDIKHFALNLNILFY